MGRSAIKATVWLTTYKATDYLRLAYVSLPRRGIRVGIVDDGGGLDPAEFPDATVISRPRNGGVTATWNTALENSDQTKPVVICNDDVVFSDSSIQIMLNALASSPEVGIVGPVTNQPGVDVEQHLSKWSTINHPDNWRRTEAYAKRIIGGLRIVERVNGFAFALNPKAMDQVGWRFNPVNKHWGNEYELQRRLRKAGYVSAIAPAFIFHFKHVTMRRQGVGGRWKGKSFPRL